MRVIAGLAKGRNLKVPREVSRPTTDRVRESVFGILAPVIEGAQVLDLFAGSGALGIEALSRGAETCHFVEQNRGAARVIEGNLKKTNLENGRVTTREVSAFLKSERRRYDLIFADPPYPDGLTDPARDLVALTGWPEWLEDDGYLILESEAMGTLADPEGLKMIQQRDYGRSRISIFKRDF